MSGFTCPFCNKVMAVNSDTLHLYAVSFEDYKHNYEAYHDRERYNRFINKPEQTTLEVKFYKCPSCDKVTIIADGKGLLSEKQYFIHPTSNSKQFPEYVPEAIRNDYEEACEILYHSPKASATLSRRCLQGMIRDFHRISKSRLIDEINALKPLISASQWSAIDAVRKIGNIGAHMEKDVNTIVDVEPEEAEKLIKLIELLIDKWYIARYDEEQLYQELIGINDEKQTQKLSGQ